MGKRRRHKKESSADTRKQGDASSSPKGRGLSGAGDRGARAPHGSWFATHGRDLKFLLVFGVLIGLYYVSTTFPVIKQGFFPWYLQLNAEVSAVVLQAVGFDDVFVEGRAIRSPDFAIQIERGCDAIEPSALFVAAVLASPVLLKLKIPAVLLGAGLLLVLNLVRIVTLFLTGLYFKSLFDMMHLDVWQAAFIVLAILFWAAWASWVRRAAVRPSNATSS